MSATAASLIRLETSATVWDYLALRDDQLERADLVALDLVVARGIEKHKDLDVNYYSGIVDQWTKEFASRLSQYEKHFWEKGPQRWKNDIRFYRVGSLQMFLGQVIGIRYIEEQREAKHVRYTNPGDLFLNGLIDTRRGTCANMATLHVAMARRMGWPVTLACVGNHKISRFDDGRVIHNVECAFNEINGFSSGSDQDYLKKFNLPKKAIECGSDLRKLSAREMIGVFIGHRGRHYQDIGRRDLCDVDCSLARALYPAHRGIYDLAMLPFLERGEHLFNADEQGHPRNKCGEICAQDLTSPSQGAVQITAVRSADKQPGSPTIGTVPVWVDSVTHYYRQGLNL